MDDQARAIKWYLDNSVKLDLRIKKFKWNLPFDSNIVDCQATIKIDGYYFEVRGSDFSEDTAFLKALGEALDRFLHFKYEGEASTTSGFATHVNFEKAIMASQYEIIERDKFLCHFLTNTPFYSSSINLDQLKMNKDFFRYLENQKVEFN